MRPVDISSLKPVDREGVGAGAVPELRWLPIADLVIDDTFQRPIEKHGWARIRKIAEAFSWGKFAPVVASPVIGGRYSLIDGQHRTHAAALCGFDMVPAIIVVLAPSDQAASFAAINGNVTRISAFHVLKAALAAEEPWAVRARDAVAAAGCELMTYHPSSKNKRPGEVYAIAAVRRFVDLGRADVVRAGLAALAALPDATVEHFSEGVLSPWFGALAALGGGRMAEADLPAFVAANDLVLARDGLVAVQKQPEYRGRTLRDLTQSAYFAMLSRFIGAGNLPAPVTLGEDGIAARMAAQARADVKAQKRAGIA